MDPIERNCCKAFIIFRDHIKMLTVGNAEEEEENKKWNYMKMCMGKIFQQIMRMF